MCRPTDRWNLNATGAAVPWGELLTGANVTWVSDDFLREQEVGQWMELPLWLVEPGLEGMLAADVGGRRLPVSASGGERDAGGAPRRRRSSTASA